MNKIVKLVKENVFIVASATVVSITILGFMIFGFLKPSTSLIEEELNIIDSQDILEDAFMEEFKNGVFSEKNPFFVLDPYEMSPLTGLMMFETSEVKDYIVVINGKEVEGDIEFQISSIYYENSDKFLVYAPIYGLYPNYLNKVQIFENILGTKGAEIHSFRVQTLPLPEDVDTLTTIETTYEYFEDDIMILMPAVGNSPVGYDYNGDVRWYLSKQLTFAPELLKNGHLLLGTNRLMSDPYYVTGLLEIDYLGKVYREYTIPGGYHHDVVELPNGNLLALSSSFDGTVEDLVVEIDVLTGDIIKEWDIGMYIPETQGPAQMWTTFDWFHNNSIDYDEETDAILLSGRHQDIVISIGYTYNTLNYIIGNPDNWPSTFVNEFFLTPTHEDFEWQYAQHSAIYTPDGIFILDNGNNKSKDSATYVSVDDTYTRGVLYQISEDNTEITQVYQFGKELGNEFYSPYISNVQYLDTNNYMIHSGGHASVDGIVLNEPAPLYDGEGEVILKSMTYEVLNNEVVYYLETNSNYYQALHTSLYTSSTSYLPGRGRSIGELAVTKPMNIDLDLEFNFFETVPTKYELTFVKEPDRLVMNGLFDKGDVIYLIFENEEEEIIYKIPTSNDEYTAMCLGLFIEDQREIIYYINETNLTGYYEIYLVVNGEEYNTYKHVIFD